MTNSPPTLAEWHGTHPAEICTVGSLQDRILGKHDTHINWIAKLVNNVVVESYPLTDWHIAKSGKLIGMVDTGERKLNVSIRLDEFVILTMVES